MGFPLWAVVVAGAGVLLLCCLTSCTVYARRRAIKAGDDSTGTQASQGQPMECGKRSRGGVPSRRYPTTYQLAPAKDALEMVRPSIPARPQRLSQATKQSLATQDSLNDADDDDDDDVKDQLAFV